MGRVFSLQVRRQLTYGLSPSSRVRVNHNNNRRRSEQDERVKVSRVLKIELITSFVIIGIVLRANPSRRRSCEADDKRETREEQC